LLKFSDTGNDDDQVSIWDDGAGGLVVWVDGATDTIPVPAVREVSVSGMGGNDLLKLNPGVTLASTLTGGVGDDTLIGGANRDEIFGGAGDDILIGNATHDAIFGDDGNDTLIGGAGGDALFGAGGNDRLDGGDGNDYVEGGAGHDVLAGGPGADTIYGVAGNDVLLASDNAKDTVDGGDGFDDGELDPLDDVALIESSI
jgi:Ca2+-binding RTX toxin-like protein